MTRDWYNLELGTWNSEPAEQSSAPTLTLNGVLSTLQVEKGPSRNGGPFSVLVACFLGNVAAALERTFKVIRFQEQDRGSEQEAC